MEIVEKEGGFPVFDTDILNTFFFFFFFFLPTVDITARLTGKICTHLPHHRGVKVSKQFSVHTVSPPPLSRQMQHGHQ